jgi:hypothetical protein
MAAAMERAKNVMAALLAEAEAGIKGLSQRFAFCAICAYLDGQLAQRPRNGKGNSKSKSYKKCPG